MSTCSNDATPKYKQICLYVTGYGTFCKMKSNPTQKLIEMIKTKYHNKLNTKFTQIKYATVYDVNSRSVDQNFPKLIEMITNSMNTNANNKETLHIIINYGLNCSEMNINVETEAINSLNENVGFMDDFIPRKINPKKTRNYKLATKINVPVLLRTIQSLSNKFQNMCSQSYYAGDYLCNYLMYKSIEFSHLYDNTLATFVHIPREDSITIEENIEFLKVLIKAFEKMYLDINE